MYHSMWLIVVRAESSKKEIFFVLTHIRKKLGRY